MTEFLNRFSPTAKLAAAVLAVILFASIIVSCSRPAYQPYAAVQPQYAPQVAPVVQAAPPVTVVNSGGGSHLGETIVGSAVGGAIGSYLGNSLSNRNQPQQPAYVPPTARPYIAPVAPAQRYVPPQTVTSSRGVTTTVVTRPSTYGTSTRQSISVGRPSTPARR